MDPSAPDDRAQASFRRDFRDHYDAVLRYARRPGRTLTLDWTASSLCRPGPSAPDRVGSRVLVEESATTVHLLLGDETCAEPQPVQR